MAETAPVVHIRWAALSRGWALRPSNPNTLMRPCDRFEAAFRIVAVLAVVLLVPFAGALGTQTYTTIADEIRIEQRTRSAIDATIVGEPEHFGMQAAEARVNWDNVGRDGAAKVAVPLDSHLGDRISIWVDDHGNPSEAPRDPGAAATGGVTMAVASILFGGFGAWGATLAVSWQLSRRRNRQWAREWRALTGTSENLP